jgi:DNA-binding transcriptional LysR family regulator
MGMMTMPRALDALQPSWLAAFLAVARHRNFTRAAEELRLTQPAVSRQMRALQEALGVRLVEQVGKTIAVTDVGRAFLEEAQRVRAGAQLTYSIRNARDIEKALVSNELDVGFVGAALDALELEHEPLLVDHVVLYSSRDHPLARRRRIPPAELAQHLFVLREKGSGTRALFEA